jgi:hypothetical protein
MINISPLKTRITPSIYRRRNRRRKAFVIFIVSFFVLLLTALTITPFIAMDIYQLNKPVVFDKVWTAGEFNIEAHELTLITDDDLRLEAWEVTAVSPRAQVIFLSGIQYPSVTFYFPHAKWLQQNGYSSMLVEMRAHGGSEGSEIALGMKEYLDVKAAVDYIKAKDNDLPVVVFGVSMGGATAINAFGRIPYLDGLISLSAYTTWPDVFCFNMKNMGVPEPIPTFQKPFVWLYMGITFGFSNLSINPLEQIENHNGRPALLMHAVGDSQVQFECFEKLYGKIPRAEIFVREGDHHMVMYNELIDPEDDPEYAAAILGFLKKFFP